MNWHVTRIGEITRIHFDMVSFAFQDRVNRPLEPKDLLGQCLCDRVRELFFSQVLCLENLQRSATFTIYRKSPEIWMSYTLTRQKELRHETEHDS
jgi:hypothetical protein